MLDLLKESGMEGCKSSNHRLQDDDSNQFIDSGRFQRLVGRLIYLSLTHLDITYAMSVVSQFMHAPTQDHMGPVYRILRYLKGCPRKGLLYMRHDH